MDLLVIGFLVVIVITMAYVLKTLQDTQTTRMRVEQLKSKPRTMTLTQARINRARKKLKRK
jgi:hypothetical protein